MSRSKVVVVGAGVGGLACALTLARDGHAVTVVEQGEVVGGKLGWREQDGFAWDTGPSLLTVPALLAEVLGPELGGLELLEVDPITRYRFADGSGFSLWRDHARSVAELEAWSPGAGADWTRFLSVAAAMWSASDAVLRGPAPWPPRRRVGTGSDDPAPDPRALLAVRPWHTLRTLAAALIRDPRLRMVVERFSTYAGADPRRAPAALATAGYVEHAFGAWHPRGGLREVGRALASAYANAGGELRLATRAHAVVAGLRPGAASAAVRGLTGRGGAQVRGVELDDGLLEADAVVFNGDAQALSGVPPARSRERSLSGFGLLLGLERAREDRMHHEIRFPADYDAEFDDVFVRRRAVRHPTLYLASPGVTDPGVDVPGAPGGEGLFVLVNAPLHRRGGPDWDALAAGEAERLIARLDLGQRPRVVAWRSPADLERETGAVGGSIYGDAPHGRLGTLGRPPNAVSGVRGLWRVGGTTHPGGGLPLVLRSGRIVAADVARALR